MKKIFLIAALFAASASVFAQQGGGAFADGTGFAHIGIGVGGGFYTGTTTLPPLSVSYEKGVTDNISVGGIIGYSSSKYDDYGYSDYVKYTYLLIGARGNYHFTTSVDKLDLYAGLTLGYNVVSSTVPEDYGPYSASASAVLLGAQVGANYYFSDNVGGFAELGYGIGILTIGVTFKM